MLKLILVSAGLMVIIFGGLFLALVFGKKQKEADSCSSEGIAPSSFGCGCGSGACGLPVSKG
ncbi:MAG TPA: hypothetical protein PL017_05180 [Tenuifilaceae bacterium]|nr:hypothetical protein [Tenuifilaceae bacterium]HPE18099.1 hypothetical protein [Tenuifilaceae bacterium]HPJ45469.1 hypothetical protein [Tenuifilaceae bacterium]HPQ33177.1 hypothetical protein [Tenuifilaceae bacterium]HRX67114.1 hypothetical protein [Tenuifilaceae bacterium]